ncbi:MAG: M48 family metalloprotease, partial [Planctomycetota bacterium]
MRIPFDLIAVILCADRIGDYLSHNAWDSTRVREAFWVWPIFWLASWYCHDVAARVTERRTERYRAMAEIPEKTLHPNQFFSRCTIVAQALSVLFFAAATWYLNWPMAVSFWPRWFGLHDDVSLAGFTLAKSVVVASSLKVGPYLVAMVLSWIPRRRLASGSRRSQIPLLTYLSFEAKLTWLPFCVSVVLAIITDIAQFLPHSYTAWLEYEPAQSLFIIGMMALAATVIMPLAAVTLWDCHPIPDGALKLKLEEVIARSGVKTRAILIWGGRNTGLLNAAVLGTWSRFRYVLISPMLAETLSVEETEAVLGHELGHARYGHPILYLAVYLSIMMAVSALYGSISQGWSAFPLLQVALMMTLLISFIYFFFGAVSRQCEREADLASAELIG